MFDVSMVLQHVDSQLNQINDGLPPSKLIGETVLNHDVVKATVYNLTSPLIDMLKERGYQLTTVADCLGDLEPYKDDDFWSILAAPVAQRLARRSTGHDRSWFVRPGGIELPMEPAIAGKAAGIRAIERQKARSSKVGQQWVYYGAVFSALVIGIVSGFAVAKFQSEAPQKPHNEFAPRRLSTLTAELGLSPSVSPSPTDELDGFNFAIRRRNTLIQ